MEWEPTDGTGKPTALRKSTCLFGRKTFPRTVPGSPPAPDSSWKTLSKQSLGVSCHGWRCPCSSAPVSLRGHVAECSHMESCHQRGSLEQMNKPGEGSSTRIPPTFAVSKGAPSSPSTAALLRWQRELSEGLTGNNSSQLLLPATNTWEAREHGLFGLSSCWRGKNHSCKQIPELHRTFRRTPGAETRITTEKGEKQG